MLNQSIFDKEMIGDVKHSLAGIEKAEKMLVSKENDVRSTR